MMTRMIILRLMTPVLMLETVSAQNAADPAASPGPASEWVTRSWQTEDGLPQNAVNALMQTRDGFLWVGTNGGLARYDGVRFWNFGLRDGLRSVVVMALAEDRQGAVWAGTSGGGLSRWENGRFKSFGGDEGFPSGADVIALAADRDGSLWIGTGKGLVRWNGGAFEIIGRAQGLPRKQIRSLLLDSRGILWASVLTEGLYRGENGAFVREQQWQEGEPAGAYCLMEGRDGSIWAGRGSGVLWQRRDGEWKKFDAADGLPKANVECLAQEEDGTVWGGARGGGLFRSGGARYAPAGNDAELSGLTVHALTVDREGSVWAGTVGGGLKRLSPRLLEDWGPENGLPEGMITSVTEDGAGSLWVGTASRGIYRFSGGRFTKLEDPAEKSGHGHRSFHLPVHCRGPSWSPLGRTQSRSRYHVSPRTAHHRDAGLMNPSNSLVYILDDEPGMVRALSRLLRTEGFEVKGFTSPGAFLETFQPGKEGCLVLDVAMPELDGLNLQKRLTHEGILLPIVFLTGHGDIPMSVRAMKAGAVDFLIKPVNAADLICAVRNGLSRAAELSRMSAASARLAGLTPRERDVLEHVVIGKMNKQIAADLGTGEQNIKIHRARVMQKMEVTSVADLVRVTEQLGIGSHRG